MKRIEFIDQLKGVAMLMVVFGHLMQFSFGVPHSTLEVILEAFDLPLFFFVSGFFCYKGDLIPIFSICQLIAKKMRAYLLPLFSVGMLHVWIDGYPLQNLLNGGGKLWFLYSLFVISTICVILNQISEFLQKDKQRWWIDVLVYTIPYFVFILMKYGMGNNYSWLPINHMVNFYRYFVLGMMIRKYNVLNKLVSQSQTAYTIAMVCFVIGVVYAYCTNIALIFLSALGGIIVLWNFMQHIETPSMSTSALSKIGKHTLAIYVFHYFFLPDLSFFATYINTNHQFILQLALCLAASSVIITLCIFIENMIDRSALLRFVLLGKK